MKTYLSVDIDFFNDPELCRKQLRLLMNRIGKRIPVLAVMNHQQMLLEVNASEARRLINIDQHSDLAEVGVSKLNCGTWISYVRWRKDGEYIWIRSHADYQGSCNGDDRGNWAKDVDWGPCSSQYIKQENIKVTAYLCDCVGVGICMSPAYASKAVTDVFREIVDQYGIPYRKGLMNESNSRKVRPPGIHDPIVVDNLIRKYKLDKAIRAARFVAHASSHRKLCR